MTSNFSTSIVRTQLHSTIPGGTFDLIYTSPLGSHATLKTTITLGSPALAVRNALQALAPELNVRYNPSILICLDSDSILVRSGGCVLLQLWVFVYVVYNFYYPARSDPIAAS